MTIYDALFYIVAAVLVYKWWIYVAARDSNGLDFNLNDPLPKTAEERRKQLERLIDRANAICELENVPGVYIRIDEEKYAQLVEQDRLNRK